MPRPFDVLTFDCYGTLIDWETGIASAFARLATAAGREAEPSEVLPVYAEIEPQVEAGPFRSYRDVLFESGRRVADRLGLPLAPAQGAFLAENLPDWRPFLDTVPALRRLRAAGYRLGILSNVDDDLLAGSLRRLEAPFEFTVTAQQVRAYKPAHAHFLEAWRRIGPARWLHVAQSLYHDVAPALALQVPVVWVNRHGEPVPPGLRPLREFHDLLGVAAWLCDGPASA